MKLINQITKRALPLTLLLMPRTVLATTYGQGLYGAGPYGGTTGFNWMDFLRIVFWILLVLIGLYLLIRMVRKRRQPPAQSAPTGLDNYTPSSSAKPSAPAPQKFEPMPPAPVPANPVTPAQPSSLDIKAVPDAPIASALPPMPKPPAKPSLSNVPIAKELSPVAPKVQPVPVAPMPPVKPLATEPMPLQIPDVVTTNAGRIFHPEQPLEQAAPAAPLAKPQSFSNPVAQAPVARASAAFNPGTVHMPASQSTLTSATSPHSRSY